MTYDEIEKADYRELSKLSEKEIYDVVTTVIKHYRKVGFPYFELNTDKIRKETLTVFNQDSSKLELENNVLQQSMHGLNTCNTFHPEMYDVRCNNSKSPMDIFLDDDLFRKALTKRIKYNDRNLNSSCVRRTLTAFGGQAVSNFRPSIAKWVYQKFAPKDAIVLDPCMGYGGRLMGAYCSHIQKYVGIDPNAYSYVGNATLYSYLHKLSPEVSSLEIELHNVPFEEFTTDTKFDLVFTSPPYFDTEKYAQESTQSYIRYPVYTIWRDNFLFPLIKKSYDYLKDGGYLVLNVGKPIDVDTFLYGNDVFNDSADIYYMRLSKLLGKGNKSTISHKTEPIFIWKKNQYEN